MIESSNKRKGKTLNVGTGIWISSNPLWKGTKFFLTVTMRDEHSRPHFPEQTKI